MVNKDEQKFKTDWHRKEFRKKSMIKFHAQILWYFFVILMSSAVLLLFASELRKFKITFDCMRDID
jgi:hypothetical protein